MAFSAKVTSFLGARFVVIDFECYGPSQKSSFGIYFISQNFIPRSTHTPGSAIPCEWKRAANHDRVSAARARPTRNDKATMHATIAESEIAFQTPRFMRSFSFLEITFFERFGEKLETQIR